MRDLVRKVISKHASNEKVKLAAWWSKAPSTKDGVSLRQRLRLLAYGPTAEANETELALIEHSYELLNKTAHGSKQPENAIEASMKSAEQLLLLILRRRVLIGG